MEIRTATPVDAEGLAACLVPSWLEAHRDQIPAHLWERRRRGWTVRDSAAAWKRTLIEISSESSPRSHVFVATEAGAVLGLVMGTVGGEGRGEVNALYVVPERQRHGIGRQLLSASLETLGGAGASSVEVVVLAANAPARRFYEALGARDLGPTEVDEDGEPLPGTIYEWPLDHDRPPEQ
jgi:ribosomal protein S18 acetylase RimI-like enzyme